MPLWLLAAICMSQENKPVLTEGYCKDEEGEAHSDIPTWMSMLRPADVSRLECLSWPTDLVTVYFFCRYVCMYDIVCM